MVRFHYPQSLTSSNTSLVVSFICEQILLVQLPIVRIDDLITNPNQNLMLKLDGNNYFARISYDPGPNGFLGKGAFKTTMQATLQFEGKKPLTGLGSTPTLPSNQVPSEVAPPYTVALKRVFQEKFRSKVITRLGNTFHSPTDSCRNPRNSRNSGRNPRNSRNSGRNPWNPQE
jgi:hypothetical protein